MDEGARSPDVTVIVCAYTLERWGDLRAAIDSVRGQEPPPGEILLVVDHDPELLRRARAELEGVTVLENGGPRGLSAARNTGVAAASGEIIAFLDDDARAEPGWLRALVGPYADARVLGTGGHAEPRWDAGRPAWFPREFDWVVGCSYLGAPEAVATIRNPLGCNMSFRREVFDRVGGFRLEVGRVGRLPAGCEETEFCIRATADRPDGRIVHVPAARVSHRVPSTRSRWRYFRSRCYAEGRSKAVVSVLAGTRRGLSSERAYTARTLPRGVARGLADALRGDRSGAARAGAIVIGLLTTVAGYGVGRAALAIGRLSGARRPAADGVSVPRQP